MESENEEYLLSLLYQQKEEKLKQQRDKQRRAEQVSLQLEKEARVVLTRYQKGCEDIRPQAQVDLKEIVMPWWQKMCESRLLHELPNFIGKRAFLFCFNTGIQHWWPYRSLLGGWSQERPLLNTASFISEYKSDVWGQYIQKSVQYMLSEQWRGYFCIAPDKSFSDLMLYRFPPSISCGFRGERYALAVDTEGSFLSRANPIVAIEFAKQIQDGTVVRVIEQGIKYPNEFNGDLKEF